MTRQTVANHLKALIKEDYVIDKDTYYLLPKIEKIYFKIPLDTLQYLLDTVKDGVIKTYIYLGQRWNYKNSNYIFTIKEICEHLGLSYNKQSATVTNLITALAKNGLIEIETLYDETGKFPKYRLKNFSLEKHSISC